VTSTGSARDIADHLLATALPRRWNHTRGVAADRCRDGWSAHEDEPHLETKDELVRYATSRGWVFTGDRALCADCVRVETCALTGHIWGRWTRLTGDGRVQERQGRAVWVRYCRICTIGESDPPTGRS